VELLFKIAYFAGMVLEVIIRAPYDRQRRKVEKVDRRVTISEVVLLTILSIGTFVLPLVYTLTPWLSVADYHLSAAAQAASGGLGLAFLAQAIWLFWRAHRDLGAYWSPSLEIGEQQRLVTQGVYHLIRHPMYSSELLWGIGQVLMLHNWIVGPGGLVTFVFLYFLRVPKEERMMLDHFGDEYRAYSSRTGRFLPRFVGHGG
jgi:protein-S-isoprenylcysteine O-methyltransferase Ste14